MCMLKLIDHGCEVGPGVGEGVLGIGVAGPSGGSALDLGELAQG